MAIMSFDVRINSRWIIVFLVIDTLFVAEVKFEVGRHTQIADCGTYHTRIPRVPTT